MTGEATPEYMITDPSNRLLAPGPSVLSTAVALTDEGLREILTIRTSSVTVTVMLDRFETEAWATQLSKDAERLAAPVSGLQP